MQGSHKSIIGLVLFTYVLGVSVLFSNLFVGIMINMFGFGSDCCAQINGRPNTEGTVRLKMTVTLERDVDDDESAEMIQSLGDIAAVLHFPPEWLCIETVRKFGSRIHQEGGVHSWAMKTCLSGMQTLVRTQTAARLRRLMKSKSLRCIYGIGSNEVGKYRLGRLLVALDNAFAIAGLRVQDNIKKSDDVWRLIEFTCDQLDFVQHSKWAARIRVEFERRFEGWMKRSKTRRLQLFDVRHLNTYTGDPLPAELLYDGTLKPEKASMTHIRFCELFVASLIKVSTGEGSLKLDRNGNSSRSGGCQ